MNAVRPWLLVGKLAETLYAEPLHQANIGAMLQLAKEVKHSDIASLYLKVEDGEALPANVLARGVAFVHEQHAEGKNGSGRVWAWC